MIDAWLADLHSIGYVFPSIIEQSSSSSIYPPQERRTAVCVTGLAECIEEGWHETYPTLRSHLSGDIDIFLFLSSSLSSSMFQGSSPMNIRLQQVRSFLNSTVTILYEDRSIDPHIPSNCLTFYNRGIYTHIQANAVFSTVVGT